MKILIGCAHSAIEQDEFTRRGHDVTQCDLLPSEGTGKHIQGDLLDILYDGWDMLIVHPTCTYLCSSGLHWNKRRPGRAEKTEESIEFCKKVLAAPIERICLENPVGCLSSRIRKPDQIVQPWMFGHPESKATCYWLKGLPLLKPTNVLTMPECGYWENQTPSRQNKLGPSKDRWKTRSRCYLGIAQAMAEQWG